MLTSPPLPTGCPTHLTTERFPPDARPAAENPLGLGGGALKTPSRVKGPLQPGGGGWRASCLDWVTAGERWQWCGDQGGAQCDRRLQMPVCRPHSLPETARHGAARGPCEGRTAGPAPRPRRQWWRLSTHPQASLSGSAHHTLSLEHAAFPKSPDKHATSPCPLRSPPTPSSQPLHLQTTSESSLITPG